MKLGVLVQLNDRIDEELKKGYDLGFSSCQLCCWDEKLMNDENARLVNECCEKYGISVSTFLKECGYNGTITIEREISGEKQISDIRKAKEYLETLI